jgi:hypothetical protein
MIERTGAIRQEAFGAARQSDAQGMYQFVRPARRRAGSATKRVELLEEENCWLKGQE